MKWIVSKLSGLTLAGVCLLHCVGPDWARERAAGHVTCAPTRTEDVKKNMIKLSLWLIKIYGGEWRCSFMHAWSNTKWRWMVRFMPQGKHWQYPLSMDAAGCGPETVWMLWIERKKSLIPDMNKSHLLGFPPCSLWNMYLNFSKTWEV